LASNLLFMFVLEAVSLPTFVALFNVVVEPIPVIGTLALGALGLAAVGTLFSAIAAHTRAREVMLPVLLFPVIVPILIGVVQGIVQRVFYFHVPMAWVSYLAFFVVLVASVMYLWKRDLTWDAVARASVEIGVVFTTLVLITGSLWAKPIWNTWWTWDARLTSTLVLWFIYVAYIMLRASTPDVERGARFGAVLGTTGFSDIPILRFSGQRWRTP